MFSPETVHAPPLISQALFFEVRHRAVMQLMALIAWRHEHGQLPGRLEDLVGTYLNHLPLDPLTGKQFVLVTTMDDLKQLLPDVQWQSESTPTEKPLLPALFTRSLRML